MLRLLFCLSLVFSIRTLAFEPPKFEPNIVDQAQLLTATEKKALEDKIQSMIGQGVLPAILTVKSLEGESIEAAAEKTFREWELGTKGVDNGVLLIFSMNDRRARIEVGYGLEHKITDLESRVILDDVVLPHFKNRQYFDGLSDGLDEIAALSGIMTDSDPNREKPFGLTKHTPKSDLGLDRGLFYFLTWVAIVCFFFLRTIRRKSKPHKERLGPLIGLAIFFVINPGVFIFVFGPVIGDLLMSKFGPRSGLETWAPQFIFWIALIAIWPPLLKLIFHVIGKRRAIDCMNFENKIEKRLSKERTPAKWPSTLHYVLNFSFGRLLLIVPFTIVCSVILTRLSPTQISREFAIYVGLTVFCITSLSLFFQAPKMVSRRANRKWRARLRWEAILNRVNGSRMIFGKPQKVFDTPQGRGYTGFYLNYVPTPRSRSSRGGGGSWRSGSSRSSSSGGGRSGGGGASSSW